MRFGSVVAVAAAYAVVGVSYAESGTSWLPCVGLAMLAAAALVAGRRGAGWQVVEVATSTVGALLLVGLDGSAITTFGPLLIGLAVCRALLSAVPLGWAVLATFVGVSPALGSERPESAVLLGVAIAVCVPTARLFAAALDERLQRAEWAATHEPLTGVWNRQAFDGRLRADLRRASQGAPVALIAIDLDGFRVVNEQYGHGVGDRVIAEVARRIDRAVTAGGFLARVGGDEFSVVLVGGDAATLATRVISAVSSRSIDDVWLGASIGIAIADHPDVTEQEITAAADAALYDAKRAGKGRIAWAPTGVVPGRDEAEERKAVRSLWGENRISMFVQPIVDLRSGAIRSYEALARIDVGEGPCGPLPWLETAERVGLRGELELAFLRAAFDLFRRRPQGSRLNVNLSPHMLERRDVRELFAELGELHGLTLELTENAIVDDYERLQAHLAPLLERGLRLAVDDIGAGQSNMQHVTTLSPRYLKLDRSLVAGLDVDPSKAALVEAMARFSEQVGSYLVAEGVETEAERELLVRLGVPYAQGYHLGRPSQPWPARPQIAPVTSVPVADPTLIVVDEATTAAEVHMRFAAESELTAAVIVDSEATVLGLVTRHRMLAQIGSRFGFPLFGDKPVLRLADRNFVAVRQGTARAKVVARAMARPAESRYDPVLIVDARFRLLGKQTIQEILEEGQAAVAAVGEEAAEAA